MTRPSQKIFIPDTLAQWPWARHLNPHYAEVKKESAAWTEGFKAFSSKAQNAFNRCDFNLLASLAYPIATKERCRTGCDLMNLFFVIDEYSDVSGEVEVREQKNVVMSALRDPHIPRPKGEWIGGEVARQFWERAIPHASERSQQRFIDTFDQYLEAVVAQAADRSHSSIRDIQSYLEVRRDTIGAKPSFTILEQDMDIPDEVFEHSAMQDLHLATIDMLDHLLQDIVSYNLEQARGDDSHNIVTIVMNELKTDVDGAMDWVVKYHVELETKFFDALGRVPKWGEPIDSWVAEYYDGLGNWVRANDQWSFESERYFGARGVEIMKSRWVTLMPKERTEDIGPQVVNGSIS